MDISEFMNLYLNRDKLKQLVNYLNLNISGHKAALIERILAHDNFVMDKDV